MLASFVDVVGSVREKFILDFDLTPYLEDNDGREDVSLQAMLELKRYFILALRGKKHSMRSKVLDELWHNMVLHTAGYQTFCQNAFGYFLHHTPAKFQKAGHRSSTSIEFVTDYLDEFGEAPSDIWSLGEAAACDDCDSCAGCGSGND